MTPPTAGLRQSARDAIIKTMLALRTATGLPLSAALMIVGACAAPRLSSESYSVRRMTGQRAAVLQAAEASLIDQGYSIAEANRTAGVLTTHPVYSQARDEPGALRSRLGTPRRIRRIAEVIVETGTDGLSAYCKVLVQEMVTNAYRFRAMDARRSDLPAQTAIDRDAATTREQNTVWRTIRRDKRQERAILAAISERTAPTIDD